MGASVRIRGAAGKADVECVRALMREYMDFLRNHPTGSAHFCIGGYEQEIDALPGKYVAPGGLWLAELDGAAVGCIAARELQVMGPMAEVHASAGGGVAVELKRLWVRPEGRGHGLGRRLMEAALEQCGQVGAAAVYLDTVPAAMPEAVGLYERLGFTRAERYNANDLKGVAYFCRRLRGGMEPAEVQAERNPTN